jgi:hypothetical protein
VSILYICDSVLKTKPDVSKSPEAEASWNKLIENVTAIRNDSLAKANQIENAGMKIQVINDSIDKME